MNPTLAAPPPTNGTPTPAASQYLFGPIASDIEVVDRKFSETLAGYRSTTGQLIHHLRHYRGKRLRPALLLLSGKALGELTPAHHVLATAVEMIHTATLVHDDVLDEAETRRHTTTINADWGNKVSILLGDLLFTHAFHLTSTVDRHACELIGDATNRVCAGELHQVTERGNLHLTESEYFEIIDGKTAALTEVCGRIGAKYAGGDAGQVEAMANYGRNIGLAFQVADDVLDLTGDEHKTGKTLGTDLKQLKLTLPLIYTLSCLPPNEAEELRAHLQAGDGMRQRVISDALRKTGAIQYARRRAEEFARSARANLTLIPRGECRNLLERLTEWAIRREK